MPSVTYLQTGVNFVRKLIQHRGLIKSLVVRDLKSRYVGSVMGFFWSVIHPLVLLASYTFVFSIVMKRTLGPEAGTTSFAIYLFCGILPWLVFQETLTRSSNILVDHANLITKTLFPSEILPVSVLIANLINHLIGLGIFLAVSVFSWQKMSWLIVLIPIYLLALSLFALGLGWIVASVQVFLRDTAQVLAVVLTFWFWFTPIFFDEQALPEKLRVLMQLNPLATVVTAYRNCLLNHEIPHLRSLLLLYVIAMLAFIGGGLFFKHTKRTFADVL
ncbi:MAG: ABC transporter permease [Terriglobia bacterium]